MVKVLVLIGLMALTACSSNVSIPEWVGDQNPNRYGYKSYDWLFDESYDNIDKYEWEMNFNYPKLKSNMRSVEKVMNMDRDKLINKIIDSKDILEHNRNLLIQCKSIERIITKFYETTI